MYWFTELKVHTASGLAGSSGSNHVIRTLFLPISGFCFPVLVSYMQATSFCMVVHGSSRLKLCSLSNLNGKGNFALTFFKLNLIALTCHVTILNPIGVKGMASTDWPGLGHLLMASRSELSNSTPNMD